jgi:two-component system response regulator FixJ
MTSEVTVFVVDDDLQFLEFMSTLIRSMDMKSMTFSSAGSFLQQFDPQRRGCLIVDVNMPISGGLELQESLSQEPLFPPIIVVTGAADVPTAVRAMKYGAIDLLQKPFYAGELYDAIQRALAKDIANREKHARATALSERLASLSSAEHDVLRLLVNGDANKKIAATLEISQRAVEDRRAKLMRKLGVATSVELIGLAIEASLCNH